MKNEKITSNMSIMDMIMVMSEGNPGAITILADMLNDPTGILDIFLLDSLEIRGSRIWMLYSDCCEKNKKKFDRTLMALRCGAYLEEEIQANLSLCRAVPFLDDSIQIEGVPSYEENFGPTNDKWEEYIEANKVVVVPKIHERMEEENFQKRHLK